MTPALAASPAWTGLVMVPNWAMNPAAMLVAMERAKAASRSGRPSRRAQAAAAPIAPRVPVACQPRLRCAGFTPWPTRPMICKPVM